MTVNLPKTKIDVGCDFKIGDISGVAAIGSNNTQTIYKNCTFEYPDGSTKQGKLWLYAEGVRPNTDPDKIFGRQEELEKIDFLLKGKSALAITGFRGTGKSTLASMYIDQLEQRGEYAGIYWRKVDETINISDIVGSFFTVIGKPIKELGRYSDGDLLDLFLRELNTAPYFLVLDNFEILLDPQTNKPMKPGFSELIERVNNDAGRSRIVFTSWECPASNRGIRPKCYTISGLDESSALRLLKESGLTEPEDELKKAIKLSGGHPLALILLVQLIDEDETLSNILDDNILWMGDKGEVAVNILDKVYEERLNEKEQKLLQYVSLYRSPVPIHAIVTVAKYPEWDQGTCMELALQLKRKSLLKKTGENYWEESLISIYAYNKLDDIVKHHKSACDYFISFPLPEEPTNKEDIQPLLEAYYHACRAKDYNNAFNIMMDYKLHEDLDKWGNYRTLIDLYLDLLPEDHFNDTSLLYNPQSHSVVLGNLGNAYTNLGQVEKAIEYHEHALVISKKIGDRRGEGNAIGDLGNAYSDLGQVEKAIEYLEPALVIAKETGNRRGEGDRLGNLGNASSDLGQVEKAIEYYEKALMIAKEIGDRRGERNRLGNLGIVYSDLGQVEKAIEYHEQALVISKEIGDRQGEGTNLGNLGVAYSDLGQVEKAIEYYEKTLVISKEIGDRRGEGNHLGNLGNAYSHLGQVKKAIEYHEQALVIAKETGDRRGEISDLGNFGNAYRNMGQVEKAIEYYEHALVIAKEIGDRQGEGHNLGDLGNAYSHMGQVEKAIEYCEKALVIAKEIGDRRGEGHNLGDLGNAYSHLGQVEKAIEYHEQAMVISKETGNRRGEVNALGNLGNASSDLGQVEKAIEYHEQALVIAKQIVYRRGEGSVLGNLGYRPSSLHHRKVPKHRFNSE